MLRWAKNSWAIEGPVIGVLLALFAAGCTSEPCYSDELVPVDPDTTPFSGGETVFSQCASCPDLPTGISRKMTVCSISFNDSGAARAGLGCFYGPNGGTSSSISNDAMTSAPNLFDYCESHCPDHDALHGCDFSADAFGVRAFRCSYGGECD